MILAIAFASSIAGSFAFDKRQWGRALFFLTGALVCYVINLLDGAVR